MFKFKLQSILEYRMNLEEKVQNEFSEVNRNLNLQKEKLKALLLEREGLMKDLRNMQNNTMKADDVAMLVAYIENSREREKEQNEIIKQAEDAVEQKRKELVEAVKNRKVLENLRDKHAEEYQKNMNDLEQKSSDEMSVLKFGRREL